MIRRVLMTTENRGEGVQNDPIRNVYLFYDEKTLEIICEHDPYLYQKLERKVKKIK